MSSSRKRVIIDPRSSYSYGSFYLYGLIQLFGRKAIRFSMQPFESLKEPGWNFRFVIQEEKIVKRYFIHTNDSYHIDKENYEWCDVYGHVNANFEYYPSEKYPKIISLVPSFGLRALSLVDTFWVALICFIKAYKSITHRQEWNKYKNRAEINTFANIKHHFGRFYKSYKNRLPYSYYQNDEIVNTNEVFFLSTLWYDHPDNQNDKGVNLRRAYFIRAVKSIPSISFSGGLLADNTSSKDKFADVLASSRMSFSDWVYATKMSLLVFNTPAFWDCHGWKLGEYLAMGKCMISTALSNDLPAPLIHGKHIHYVENTPESMQEAIEYIHSHPEYRQQLEQGAIEYWKEYGTPIKSLQLLGINNTCVF